MEQMLAPSRRQLEVLALCASGMSRQQIAGELHISQWTVKHQLDNARGRLGARNTSEAVVLCIARGHLCVDGRAERVFIPQPLEELVLVAA